MYQQQFDILVLSQLAETVHYLQSRFVGQVIYLEGALGSGKTTFAQHWLRGLGVDEVITSPTYTIANVYSLPNGRQAIHADLYRIADPEELLYLDVRDWLLTSDIILLEWATLGADMIPPADAQCILSYEQGMRCLDWTECS